LATSAIFEDGAHRLCVSLNSRLNRIKEEEEEGLRKKSFEGAHGSAFFRVLGLGYRGTSFIRNTHPHRITRGP